jgi:hypothetical protein
MKLTNHKLFSAGGCMRLLSIAVCLMGVLSGQAADAQAISTTTVQGTVYLANGQPGTGTLVVSWPTFTTASGQLVTADSTTVPIAPDGFVSVNLAANVGASPAGLYYTAVYYMSDGSTNTQYWVVPAGAQAALGQVQAQLMPATQAVQAVNKAYVDQAIAELTESLLTASGGMLSGPLTLCCDPTQPMQAADKHYVDEQSALAVPLTGATMTGPLTSVELGALYQVDQFPGSDFGAKLSACLSGLSQTNGGTCDARNFSGTLAMGSNLTISTANATVLLPCATISTGNQIIVTAETRNISLRGCALRGTSTASGSQGGTVFLYSGTAAMVQVGDPTYAADTQGFHLDNVAINITSASSASAQGLVAYRTQEMDLESLYFLGNSNQTGITLDGTGNYTGGTFFDDEFNGFHTAVNAIGHQISNPATTDWMNASAFVRLHIDCPTSGGNPVSGSYGINLQQGDGNTFTGGDIEGCSTALHLGANAQNNTIVGLRNENSTNQIVADAGSSYNSWMTGGTMFTGQLTDNGTRNSFLDSFHRSFNGLNGDWYGSQKDATLTNYYRLGIGTGNERGLLNEIQTDYGYRWLEGYSDATAGEQFYQIDDLLNNVNRLSIGQYNNGQSSSNNQTAINSAGTGAVVLNGSANAGTGGVVIGSGGANEGTVATISGAGNAQFNGSLQVGGASTLAGSTTVKNQGNAEIDYILQAGATASQKESLIYNDWNGNSQWYMVKNANNDWALNSATGGLDSFMAYQSTNSGDTYVNASNSTGVVRINYETGAGTGFKVYGGNSSTLYASFTGTTAIQFPGLAASSGHNCLQIDNSGWVTNTGAACATGSGSGTVNTGTSGQIAIYNGNGTVLSGTNTVPVTAGGTGASTASGALGNLGGAAITGASFTGLVSAPTFTSTVATGTAPFTVTSTTPVSNLNIGGNAATATLAAGLSGIQALPNGTTATTQTAGDSTAKLATDAFVAVATSLSTIIPGAIVSGIGSSQTLTLPGNVVAGAAALSGEGNSGNVAIKNASADRVQYISTTGNDANDGLSWGTAKATVAGAQAALPSAGGTIYVGGGTYSWTSTVTITTGQQIVFLGSPAINFTLSGSSPAFIIPFQSSFSLLSASLSGSAVINMQNTGGDAIDIHGGNYVHVGSPNGVIQFNNVPGNLLLIEAMNAYEYTQQLFVENLYGAYLGGDVIQINSGTVSTYTGFVNTSTFSNVRGDYLSATSTGVRFVFAENSGDQTSMSGLVFNNCVFSNYSSSLPTIYVQQTGSVGGYINATFEGGEVDVNPTSGPAFVDAMNATAANDIGSLTFIGTQMGGLGNPFFGQTISEGPGGLNFIGNGLINFGQNTSMKFLESGGDMKTISAPGHNFSITSGYSGFDFILQSSNPATSSTNQNGMNLELTSNYWMGSASALDDWTISDILGSGSNPTSTLIFGHGGSSGTASVSIPYPVTAQAFTSTVTTGTAPFTVTSTTPVPNLNIGGNAATATVAAGLSGTPALPNGATATTQIAGDTTTKLATDGFVAAAVTAGAYTLPAATSTTLGGVKPDGVTIANSSGAISCGLATTSQAGCAKLGALGGAEAYGQVNGAAAPASANGVATNSSSQLVAQTAHNSSVPRNCVTTGSANTYTCTTSPSFIPGPGDEIQINVNMANTGSSTLNVNGSAADLIYKNGGSLTLASGDLQANHWISAILDSSSHWQLEGQLGNANATQINGQSLANLATGILKNTTSTGVPVIAVAGTDYAAPNSNTTGTAAGLSGTPALPNGTTGTTQTAGDSTAKLATDAFVAAATANQVQLAGGKTLTNNYGCSDGYDHLPCIVAQVSYCGTGAANGCTYAAQSANISYTTMYTTSAPGKYRTILTVHVEAEGTAGTVQGYIQGTNAVSTVGLSLPLSVALNTTYSAYSATMELTMPSGKTIQYQTLVSGATGSPTYGLDVTVERLQ